MRISDNLKVDVRAKSGHWSHSRGVQELMDETSLLATQLPKRWQASAEQGLMSAVLHDAIDCLARHAYLDHGTGRTAKRERLRDEALEWLMAEDRSHLFSFLSICDHLELDPHAVRGLLLSDQYHRVRRYVGRFAKGMKRHQIAARTAA